MKVYVVMYSYPHDDDDSNTEVEDVYADIAKASAYVKLHPNCYIVEKVIIQ